MNEGFDLQFRRSLVTNALDLLQRQFPCQNHTFCTQLIKLVCGQIVDDTGLGGNVDIHIRNHALCFHQHTDIRYDDSIDAGSLCISQVICKLIHFTVERQGVAGQINLDIPCMSIFHRFFHGIKIKFCRCCTHTKSGSAQIYRIRAVVYRIGQALIVAYRSQNLRIMRL